MLRELVLERTPSKGQHAVRMRLWAYAGDRIDDALSDFLAAASEDVGPDLLVWSGHNRLMDVPTPRVEKAARPRPVAVLACVSQPYFGPLFKSARIPVVALTRTLMAPEAYLLEAVATAVASHGERDAPAMRKSMVAAYAKYQRISEKAAATVFADIPITGGR